jgi:hypothetical protein
MTANEAACSAHQGSFHYHLSRKEIMRINPYSQPGYPSDASFHDASQ